MTSSQSTTRTCARTIEDSSIKYTYRCCHATPDLRQSVVCDQLIFEISRDDTSRGREPFFPPPCPRLHRSPRRTQHSVNGANRRARMLVLYQGWTLRLCTCAKARRTRRPQISDGVRVSCAHLEFVFRLQLRCFADPLRPPLLPPRFLPSTDAFV